MRLFGLDLGSPRSTIEVVIANAISKALVMGVSALCAVVSTRLIIGHFGVSSYAQYGLLASMGTLVPFADFGMGAAIMNTVAESASPTASAIRHVLVSAFRVLFLSAFLFISVGLLITLTGWWPSLLGNSLLPGGGAAALACVVVFSLTLPLGVGQRLLNGLGLNHIQVRVQLIAAPFFLSSVIALILFGAPSGNYVAVFSYLSATAIAGTSLWLASRQVRPQVRNALSDVLRLTTVRGARTMQVAWPMLAQTVVLPIAMQSDRILLSNFGSVRDVAEYNLAFQLFGMVLQVVTAAGIALWPIFARSRARSEIRSPFRLSMGFFGAALFLGLALSLLMPSVVPLISDGEISIGFWTMVAFVAFVSLEALKYPCGMYMTDRRGLQFQLVPIFILVPLNLVLSWLLLHPLGPAGPIAGSAISVGLCQVIPNALYVKRDLSRRAASRVSMTDLEDATLP